MSFAAAYAYTPTPTPPEVISNESPLPSAWGMERLAHATFQHVGQDLHIVDENGQSLLVKGYFLNDTHTDLQLSNGMAFRADWADRLSMGSGDVAQTASAPSQSIGTVKTLNGEVSVTRLDGSHAILKIGDTVHQGDVLETGSAGSVGIVFLDGSNFSLGGSGKMILDEMVYDPAAQSGSADIGVLSGTFAFISGQIAKTSPDAMKVTTPSATIGFRGTSGSGQVGPDGQTSIVLIRDPDGTIGEIVLVTPAGVFTLSTVLQVAQVSIDPALPVIVQVMTAAEFQQQYGSVTSALPAANTPGTDPQQFLEQAADPTPDTPPPDEAPQD
ncbi:MAG: FecR domain-containing protein, partial [Rhodospirillaceae bacterium]|nr:FecR domain-containing protein [Rhodospirillaceae bacterium]